MIGVLCKALNSGPETTREFQVEGIGSEGLRTASLARVGLSSVVVAYAGFVGEGGEEALGGEGIGGNGVKVSAEAPPVKGAGVDMLKKRWLWVGAIRKDCLSICGPKASVPPSLLLPPVPVLHVSSLSIRKP